MFTWKELREGARELIGDKDLVSPTKALAEQLRMDIVYKQEDDEADAMAVDYCNEHYEDLVDKYTFEELDWMIQWVANLEANTENMEEPVFDRSGARVYGKVHGLTKLDLSCYLTIRGEIPEDIKGVSYSLVLFNFPLVIERTNKALKLVRIREFLRANSQAKLILEKGEIPTEYSDWEYNPIKCMVEGREEEKIEFAEVYQYFRRQFLTPGKVQKLTTRLLGEYERKYGVYPSSGKVCLQLLSEGERKFYCPILPSVEIRLDYWIKNERFETILEVTSG